MVISLSPWIIVLILILTLFSIKKQFLSFKINWMGWGGKWAWGFEFAFALVRRFVQHKWNESGPFSNGILLSTLLPTSVCLCHCCILPGNALWDLICFPQPSLYSSVHKMNWVCPHLGERVTTLEYEKNFLSTFYGALTPSYTFF